MVQFVLPADSRLQPGRRYDPVMPGPWKRIHVYRYDPDVEQNPSMNTYPVSVHCTMVLDGLLEIKRKFDGKFAFRRSCGEGICGSCAMNINGVNTLACITPMKSIRGDVVVYPLPHMQVIKDLVCDLTHAFAQYAASEPWLKAQSPCSTYQERLQSPKDRKALDGLWECILCFCCTTSCPSYWWNGNLYLGPATLLQARRWLADTRDEAHKDRLKALDDVFKLYRCHTILNCAKACPKTLNPAAAIAAIKRDLVQQEL